MASSSDPYRGLKLTPVERRELVSRLAKERGIKERSAARYVQRLTTETGKQRISGKGKAVKIFKSELTKVKSVRKIPPITRGGEVISKPPKEFQSEDYVFFYYDPLPEGYRAIVWDSPERTHSVKRNLQEALELANSYLGGDKWEEVVQGTGGTGMIHLVTVHYVPAGEQPVYVKITGKRAYNEEQLFREGGYHVTVLVGVPEDSGPEGKKGKSQKMKVPLEDDELEDLEDLQDFEGEFDYEEEDTE